jgi:hypothetical protein
MELVLNLLVLRPSRKSKGTFLDRDTIHLASFIRITYDPHGQRYNLLSIFRLVGLPRSGRMLVIGNNVRRRNNTIEVMPFSRMKSHFCIRIADTNWELLGEIMVNTPANEHPSIQNEQSAEFNRRKIQVH